VDNIIELKEEGIYFYACFYDNELSIPGIRTYIYKGLDPDGEFGHMFLSIEKDTNGQQSYITFKEGEINSMLDKAKLIAWLKEDHSPKLTATEYEYKNL
jgi:hypothetical protein